MELRIAETIKKQRKSRDMTQEELARALGVSPQSVSKWECGDGYPDITLLPVIANFFAITVDELIGNDELGRQADIDSYWKRIEEFEKEGDFHGEIGYITEFLRKYPDDYDYIVSLSSVMIDLPADERAQYMPLMNEQAEKLLKESTWQWGREIIIRRMAMMCDDADLKKWIELCAFNYNAHRDEVLEERLWQQGKHDESRLRFDVNNLRILLHFMSRNNRNWAAPERATEWFKTQIRLIEFFGEDGEIPQAWWGKYANLHFRAGCSSFGYGDKEQGYAYLERAFELYPRWLEIPCGTALPLGRKAIFNDVKMIKNAWFAILPDGTKEVLRYGYFAFHDNGEMYRAMTAPHGWEWFNDVRDEDRFKEYVERARVLMEKYPEPEKEE